jgi:hypothetical protein
MHRTHTIAFRVWLGGVFLHLDRREVRPADLILDPWLRKRLSALGPYTLADGVR